MFTGRELGENFSSIAQQMKNFFFPWAGDFIEKTINFNGSFDFKLNIKLYSYSQHICFGEPKKCLKRN